MGNPNEKSTTQPRQHFYIYFNPLFCDEDKKFTKEDDELFVILDGIDDEVKSLINLYGAAVALHDSSDTTQKPYYKKYKEDYIQKLKNLFDSEFYKKAVIRYKGEDKLLSAFNIPGGLSKIDAVSKAASIVFEEHFNEENPDYPSFTLLSEPLTKNNRNRLITSALKKICDPSLSNANGEVILQGLGLLKDGKLDIESSMYARSIEKMFSDNGNKVINRDEILEVFYANENLYITKDFKIEPDFELIVLAVMTVVGKTEIVLPTKTINAGNIKEILALDTDTFVNLNNIRRPKGVNYAAVRELSLGLAGRDLSNLLDDQASIISLNTAAQNWASRAANAEHLILNGISFDDGTEIISQKEAASYAKEITEFKNLCDKAITYTSKAKLMTLSLSADEIKETCKAVSVINKIEDADNTCKDFRAPVNYLRQAEQYACEEEIKTKIQNVLKEVPSVIASGDRSKTTACLSKLNEVKGLYASWYKALYTKNRTNTIDFAKKQRILQSEQYVLCSIIASNADFVSSRIFNQWKEKFESIKEAQDIARLLEVTPYADSFIPSESMGKKLATFEELNYELDDIQQSYIKSFRDSLNDPGIANNTASLTAEEKSLVEEFKSGKIELDSGNAQGIILLINKLQKGFTPIELGLEEMHKIFNRPMDVQSAIKVFEDYLRNESTGKDNVRVIFK